MDNLEALNGLEEWLKAAGDGAAEHGAVRLDGTDARGAGDSIRWRPAHAADLDTLALGFLGHTSNVGSGPVHGYPCNHSLGT